MNRALAFAAALFSAAGMAKAQPGPFGLDWSMTPSEVRHLENFKLYDAEDDKIIMTRTAPADRRQSLHLLMRDDGIHSLTSYTYCPNDLDLCREYFHEAEARIRESHDAPHSSPTYDVGMTLGISVASSMTAGTPIPKPLMWQRNGHSIMLMMLPQGDGTDGFIYESWERAGPTGWEMLGTAVDFWKENAPPVEDPPTDETAPE
ncbi:hypothetical protein [Parvularcula marina]|uniref:Uncharacterized protein n=1 Tax=Parvularcula marina TaxID=2292771 RepID=A0A371RG88_9PROT|nr:hypothetical protein [Parvularcula marina]RFB04435.1 hypothetical protein DX908_03505 [Parvularcula marina]